MRGSLDLLSTMRDYLESRLPIPREVGWEAVREIEQLRASTKDYTEQIVMLQQELANYRER